MYVLSNQSNSTHNIRESHAALHTEELRWGAQYILWSLQVTMKSQVEIYKWLLIKNDLIGFS